MHTELMNFLATHHDYTLEYAEIAYAHISDSEKSSG